MATIDLIKIKLNGDTGGGGKPATLESLSVSENGVYVPSEGVDGYNQVNVNVTTPTEVFVVPAGIKFAYSTFTEIPSYLDFSNISDFLYMFAESKLTQETYNFPTFRQGQNIFYNCKGITNINITLPNAEKLDNVFQLCENMVYANIITSDNLISLENVFRYCRKLINFNITNISNVTNMGSMFYGCSSLTTIPAIDTSKVTNMDSMFYDCTALQTIPQLNTSNVTSVFYMFNRCSSLQSLPLLDFGNVTRIVSVFTYNNTTLTDLGGFKNLKINWSDNNGLYRLPNLTYESVMNVINNLYDFRANGDTTTTRTIKFNPNSIALLSDSDIAIATNKGWVIS